MRDFVNERWIDQAIFSTCSKAGTLARQMAAQLDMTYTEAMDIIAKAYKDFQLSEWEATNA
jgi:hypothetical protein